jgi:hypothetical protein
MDYYQVLLSSHDLIKLQEVCSEFYFILQDKVFWKEKSEKDRIEPPVACMQDWLKHRRALLSSLLALPRDGLEIKIDRDSPSFARLYQTLLDKERERGHEFPLGLPRIQTIIFRIKRGGRRCDSLLFIILTPHRAEYNVRHKKLNLEERRSLVYQANRGTYMNVI